MTTNNEKWNDIQISRDAFAAVLPIISLGEEALNYVVKQLLRES